MRDFPSTADVGRLLPAEEAMGSERSEWERSERKDREEGEEAPRVQEMCVLRLL